MSELEKEVCPILKPLLSTADLNGFAVDELAAGVLARWAFKTAIVRNLGTNYRAIVPPSQFSEFYATRRIPNFTYVDLAIAHTHESLSGLQSQTLTGIVEMGDEEPIKRAISGLYNIVLGLNHALLRVVHFPMSGYTVRSELAHGRRAFRLHPNGMSGLLNEEAVVSDLFDLEVSTFFEPVTD